MLALAGCSGYATERKEANEATRSHVAIEPLGSVTPLVDAGGDGLQDGTTIAALWLLSRPGSGHAIGGSGGLQLPVSDGRGDSPQERVSVEYLGTADWRFLLLRYPDWDVERMMRIIECESRGDENVVSPGGHTGAYQISPIHGYSYEEMTDPVISTDIAHDIWLSQGWGAWSCDVGY